MEYIILKDNKEYSIEYFNLDAVGYQIKNKKKKITFFNEQMIHSMIINKFNKKMDNLYQIILNVLNDSDDDEGDYLLLLDDVDRLKLLADLNLKKFITNEEYKKYIDKLYFMDNMINEKLATINIYNNYEYDNSIGGKGR